MDDFEGVFEKKICRFVGAKCHIKLIYAIYMYIFERFPYTLVTTGNEDDLKIRMTRVGDNFDNEDPFYLKSLRYKTSNNEYYCMSVCVVR